MRVATAISLLQELDPEAQIAAQWYDQGDMTPAGVEGETTMTDDIWELAIAIFNKYEFPDMMYALEQAIDEARERLAKEAKA
jgi:hypothetical protein